MGVKDSYYVAREYMDCRACSGTYISWDSRNLGQLSDGVRDRFPVLMTRKYACNQNVIAVLRSRTLGNSPTALRITLHWVLSPTATISSSGILMQCENAPVLWLERPTSSSNPTDLLLNESLACSIVTPLDNGEALPGPRNCKLKPIRLIICTY